MVTAAMDKQLAKIWSKSWWLYLPRLSGEQV